MCIFVLKICHHLRLPFNPHSFFFLLNLHKSWTWAWGRSFNLEQTVPCYKHTRIWTTWKENPSVKGKKKGYTSICSVTVTQRHATAVAKNSIFYLRCYQYNVFMCYMCITMCVTVSAFVELFAWFWERHQLNIIHVWEFPEYLRLLLPSGLHCEMSYLM